VALPTIALAEHWLTVLPEDWSILQGPVASLEANASVLRSDGDWITPATYCLDEQRYAAIPSVTASSPEDAERVLYAILRDMMDNLPEGWKFVSARQVVLDQSTGSPLLNAKMTLTYSNTEQEAS
jgi:hypothetical protein